MLGLPRVAIFMRRCIRFSSRSTNNRRCSITPFNCSGESGASPTIAAPMPPSGAIEDQGAESRSGFPPRGSDAAGAASARTRFFARTRSAAHDVGQRSPAAQGFRADEHEGTRGCRAAHRSDAAAGEDEVATRRFIADARSRRVDPQRSFRRSLEGGGAGIELSWRRKRLRHPPIVAIVDISGSMSDYTRIFLHFLHRLAMVENPCSLSCSGRD